MIGLGRFMCERVWALKVALKYRRIRVAPPRLSGSGFKACLTQERFASGPVTGP